MIVKENKVDYFKYYSDVGLKVSRKGKHEKYSVITSKEEIEVEEVVEI